MKCLADSMKAFFPSDAILGRNGGDEFCVLLPNYTFEEAEAQLQQFTSLPKTFSCRGREQQFYISLGYAEYPTFASSLSQLMRCADAALYEIKLHGKNGCMSYSKKLQSVVRKQLGFALRDISEHLPGAFGNKSTAEMKMTIFIFIFERRTDLIFLYWIMGEL